MGELAKQGSGGDGGLLRVLTAAGRRAPLPPEAMATLQKLAIENAAEVQPAISAISGGIPIKKLLLVLEMSLKAPTLVDAARFTTTLQEAGLLSG